MTKLPAIILSAKPGIVSAVEDKFASNGDLIQLVAGNADKPQAEKTDMECWTGVSVSIFGFDVLETESHESFVVSLPAFPAAAVSAVWLLGRQIESEPYAAGYNRLMRTNYAGPARTWRSWPAGSRGVAGAHWLQMAQLPANAVDRPTMFMARTSGAAHPSGLYAAAYPSTGPI